MAEAAPEPVLGCPPAGTVGGGVRGAREGVAPDGAAVVGVRDGAGDGGGDTEAEGARSAAGSPRAPVS